jgi:hypothetical protein
MYRRLRRVLTKRFPYAVYYELCAGQVVRVVAIMHTAMDNARLDERSNRMVSCEARFTHEPAHHLR